MTLLNFTDTSKKNNMPYVELTRFLSNDHGTFGALHMDGQPLCVTLEDPWNDNKKNISCIPTGIYDCKKFSGAKYKDVWILENVPNRSYILIHAGNTQLDTQGCILVGKEFGNLRGRHAILRSKAALDLLRYHLPDEFTITIRSATR